MQRSCRGAVLVWVLLLFLVLVAIVGLACDTAYLEVAREQLQMVADAAALSGAHSLRTDPQEVTPQALAIAASNRVLGQYMILEPSDVSIGQYLPPGSSSPGFHAGVQPYNAVRVTARRTTGSPRGPVPLIFAPIFGVPQAEVTQKATATIFTPGYCLILDPTSPSALDLTGNGMFTVNGGKIQVNSSNSKALTITGDGTINATGLNITGNFRRKGSASLPDNLVVNSPPIPDPLAALESPTPGVAGIQSGTTFSPGYYPDGIHLRGQASYTMQPGVYIIDNGLSAAQQTSLSGQGVTLYVRSGATTLTSGGAINLTPPTTGIYQGITYFQGRSNTSEMHLTGNSDLNLEGTIYVPNALLSMTGDGYNIASLLIVNKLAMTGSGVISLEAKNNTRTNTRPYLVQ